MGTLFNHCSLASEGSEGSEGGATLTLGYHRQTDTSIKSQALVLGHVERRQAQGKKEIRT
jgi:hypothetical protein